MTYDLADGIAHPGSFRDPDSRVAEVDGRICRLLAPKGAEDWRCLRETAFFQRAVARRQVIGTEELAPALGRGVDEGGASLVLGHERVPVLSDPCEWPFGMLAAAAVLHLDLLLGALGEGMTMKDGAAANMQFLGVDPVFIDIGSFERRTVGEAWPGYQQFCATFLYPLLIEARLGVPCQIPLRSSIDGVSPDAAARLLRLRAWRRPAELTHVTMHARAERHLAGRHETSARPSQVPVEVSQGLARGLRKMVSRLRPAREASEWSAYGERSHYSEQELLAKDAFIRQAVTAASPSLVLDLGANDGRFSRIAAESAPVVAVDRDARTVDLLYHDLVERPPASPVLPLVIDLLDPTPPRGWRGAEREPLWSRVRPDMVLCLAVVHHLCIGGNVPLREVVDLLASFGAEVVVEVPDRHDPMVSLLLARKRPGQHRDYSVERFEELVLGRFDVRASSTTATRSLFHLQPS
jgi:hypothetical protein